MRCGACGVLIHGGDDFCRRCGARVSTSDKPDQPTAQVLRDAIGHRQTLADDDQEGVLWTGTFSWKGLLHWWLGAIAATVGLPVLASASEDMQFRQIVWPMVGAIWGALLVWLLYKKLTVFYTLTNQRLIHEEGFLYRKINRLEVIDIDDLRYEQGILERILGTGRVFVSSSDRSTPVLRLEGIDRADELFEILDRARREERLKHGVHIEAI